MRVLFDGSVHVQYGQFYLLSPGQPIPDLEEAFRGQVNGLLGAAIPGALWVTTGLHTGHVRLVVRLHDAAPSVAPTAEEVVEVIANFSGGSALLTDWAAVGEHNLEIPSGSWRVRLSCTGMDAARAKDTILEGEPYIDAYTLDFWPASLSSGTIVRQTSEVAAYWHAWVATLKNQPQ